MIDRIVTYHIEAGLAFYTGFLIQSFTLRRTIKLFSRLNDTDTTLLKIKKAQKKDKPEQFWSIFNFSKNKVSHHALSRPPPLK